MFALVGGCPLTSLYHQLKDIDYDEFWKQPIIGYGHKSATAANDGCRATEDVRSNTAEASIYQYASAGIFYSTLR